MNAPTRSSPYPDDAALNALVDGRLPPDQANLLQSRMGEPTRREIHAWAQQRALLQGLHGDWLERPLPGSLHQAAERLQQARATRGRWLGRATMATGWLLAFGLGWGARDYGDMSASVVPPAGAPSSLQFAQQAASAHAVYQPEQRHPVEVTAEQHDHLVQWLSRRLARPLVVPHLQGLGYELVGGRLLPGGQGARAQFMYQDAGGKRITLYLGAMEGSLEPAAPAFRFHSEGPVSSVYWIDQGFGYALSGELPRHTLETLTRAAHQQLAAARGS